jgi:Na+/melibiose symporter-like transporter
MITDVSSEMVTAVIPLYLTLALRFTALQYGVFEGMYQGIATLLRIASGGVADAWQRHKEVAGVGYVVSAGCKLGLLASGTAWQPAVGSLVLDRVGKGIRTAPRDALIALSSASGRLGEAFGVHRALDTAGALLGPVVAFVMLAMPRSLRRNLYLTSFCVAVIGCGVLIFFVENRTGHHDAEGTRSSASLSTITSVVAMRNFRSLLGVGALVSLVTASDAFVYLTFQRRSDLDLRLFPLLYVGTALAYLICAVPAGRCADRLGRGRVFLAGHVMLIGVYGVLLLPALGPASLVVCLVLLGAYYAATDGVLMALASTLVQRSQLASALAILTTVTALGRVVAAVMYGALWSWRGPEVAAGIFATGLALAVMGAAALLPRTRQALSA